MALASAVVLSACGGSSRAAHRGAGAQTSTAAAVIAFVAPRDGADAVIGAQLASFAQTVQTKLLDDCMTSDGFPVPTFPAGGPPTDLGNSQFPNLPAIKASHDLGLFTGVPSFVDPHERHERARAHGVSGAGRSLLPCRAAADPVVRLGEVRAVELGLVQRGQRGESVGADSGAE